MPSKNAARILKTFRNSNLCFLEKYQISVIEERGRYRYLHPDRDKRNYREGLWELNTAKNIRTALLTKKSDNHSLCQIAFTVGGGSSEK